MKVKKGSTISWLLIFIVLLNLDFLHIIKMPFNLTVRIYVSAILSFLLICIVSAKNLKLSYHYKTFVRHYLLYVLIVQTIICIYSMYTYNETAKDMLMCTCSYISLWLFYVIILIFENEGFEFLLNRICTFQFINAGIILVHSLIYNYTGISIFAIEPTSFNYGRLRVGLGALSGLFFCYMFYKVLKGYNTVNSIIYIVITLIATFYSETSRASELAIVCSLIIMWVSNKANSTKKIIKYEILIVGIIICFNCGVFNSILNNFSIDTNVNAKAGSTLARYEAIEYFSSITDKNPLIGMGWVRPYTPRLTTIWSGPKHSAYFDDLGFLGQFFRLGILGAMIYLLLIIRMIHIILRVRQENEKRVLLIGILSYVLFTMVSLNCFDGQRIFAVPFYMAVFEFVFKMDRINNKLIKDNKNK